MTTHTTRAEARAAGAIRYFTGLPCSRGHIVDRMASSGSCVSCRNMASRSAVNRSLVRSANKRRKTNRLKRVGCRRERENRRVHQWAKLNQKAQIAEKLRDRLRKALRGEYMAGSAVRDLGCSIAEFREYIATRFQIGMSWDNHGEWHLDHVKPLPKFDLTDRPQFLVACHFINYQPLWAKDNLAKGDQVMEAI